MSASSSAARVTGSVLVHTEVRRKVYRVIPPLSGTASVNPAEHYRGRSLPYGGVQCFIGATIFMLNVVTGLQYQSAKLSFSTGAFFWGPVMCIMAGFLTLVAGGSLKPSLVKSAVCFNIAAAVTSVAATIIFFVDASGILVNRYPILENVAFNTTLYGVAGVLSFLEFGLSMGVALSCCYSCEPTGQPLTVTNPLFGTSSVSVETPPTNKTPPIAMAPSPPYENPPDTAAS